MQYIQQQCRHYHSLPPGSSWPSHSLNITAVYSEPETFMPVKTVVLHAVFCEQRQDLKQQSPRMESTLLIYRTLASKNFFRDNLGWEELGAACEICSSNIQNRDARICLLQLVSIISKESILSKFSKSLSINKLVKCQTSKV